MKEIICPNCHTTFQVDETTYETILSQVRGKEFDEELNRRAHEIEKQFQTREEAVKLQTEKEFEKRIAEKNEEIGLLKTEQTRLEGEVAKFESRLRAEMLAFENRKEKEFNEAISDREKNIAELKQKISEKEKETTIKVLEAQDASKTEIHNRDRKILELETQIKVDRQAAENRENELREIHRLQLSDKQDQIDRLKDFKLKLSTKMLGETLEQHCMIEFSRAKSFGQFPEAVFEKDNLVVEGTKGDFIFRDYVDGHEYVSIMFEMKNEADTTATKHKNEHFFEKLDKDRKKKGCEFAILVSMLEQGNEFYDTGIVDVGYIYPKMMVIRPQFFIPVLRLVSEGAKKGFLQNRELMVELETARSESHDFTKFEEKITKFSADFAKYVKGSHDKYVAATDGIDKIIANLEKQISLLKTVKANFETSEEKLKGADKYLKENLTVKKLTHGAPSVKKMIEEAKKGLE